MNVLRNIARVAVLAAVLALAVLQIQTQAVYVDTSRSIPGHLATFLELPGASYYHVLSQLAAFRSSLRPDVTTIVSDTYNVVLGKIERDYSAGRSMVFPTANFDRLSYPHVPGQRPDPIAEHMVALLHDQFPITTFPYRDANGRKLEDVFFVDKLERTKNERKTVLLRSSNQISLFNRFYATNATFSSVPFSTLHNFTAFVDSERGHFYADLGVAATLFNLEPDYFNPGGTMAGVGRYLLVEIVHPSKRTRLVLDITSSLVGDGKNALPPAVLYGRSLVRLPFVGEGAARIVSPPFEPLEVDGLSYALIDFGTPGKHFVYRRTGLQGLFGRSIALDNRILVAFARNISIIDESDYRHIDRPIDFAFSEGAILKRKLVYSGMFEDGWLAHAGFLELNGARGGTLHFSGTVPTVDDSNFATDLMLSVNGHVVARSHLTPGPFDVTAHVSPIGIATVSWTFSKAQHLAGDDQRPVGAQLTDIGLH